LTTVTSPRPWTRRARTTTPHDHPLLVEAQVGGVEEEHLADLGVQGVHAEAGDDGAAFGVGHGELELDAVGVAGQG
jgi:hypothetical protein